MTKYLCVDESGSFNTSYEQYYIISAIIGTDLMLLRSIHQQVELQVRKTYKGTRELKGAHMRDAQKALFINELIDSASFKVVSLIIDKKRLHQKHSFKMSEFLIYNFALKELVQFAVANKFIDKEDNVIIEVDARNMNRKVYFDLESYLNLEFYESLGKMMVIYKDSSLTREIQMADYISNTMYGYFNKTNNTYDLIHNKDFINYRVIPIKENEYEKENV